METNRYVMVTGQVKPGDVITESGLRETDQDTREVTVTKVVNALIEYRGTVVPVWYVSGTDQRNSKKVVWTSNSWRRWTVTRNPVSASTAVLV